MPKSPQKRIPKPSTRAQDRGRAAYFHGREDILEIFEEQIALALDKGEGTCFLIQGAPGAGKSALLHECAERAKKGGWEVEDIYPADLYTPHKLPKRLRPKGARGSFWDRSLSVKAWILQWTQGENTSKPNVEDRIRSKKTPLLLLLDEAQMMRHRDTLSLEDGDAVGKLLDRIHQGKLDRPVILLAAGLGGTKKRFESFGISRFLKKCKFDLPGLDATSERAVIRDWLTEQGQVKVDPAEWIDAIAGRSHGWPQHIMGYVGGALDQLYLNGGIMTPEGKEAMLAEGDACREAFYNDRTESLDSMLRECITGPFDGLDPGIPVRKDAIIESLRTKLSDEKADLVFDKVLAKGVIDERDGDYLIPIPSMHTWMVDRYGKGRT